MAVIWIEGFVVECERCGRVGAPGCFESDAVHLAQNDGWLIEETEDHRDMALALCPECRR